MKGIPKAAGPVVGDVRLANCRVGCRNEERPVRRLLIPATLAPIGPDAVSGGTVEVIGGRIMGTTWSISLVPPPGYDTARVVDLIQVELARLLAQLSHWEPDSALCRFNRAPAGSRQPLPDDLYTVLATGCSIAEASGGAYDPTLGALVDLWGFGPPGPVDSPPATEAVAAALARIGWDRLELDPATRSAVQPGGLQLDLSGIAKGYAVDVLSDLLAAEGLTNHLVEIGGELRGRGLRPSRHPWWVTLESPGPSAEETVIALHEVAVASSGDYRRSLDLGGRLVGHTLDPRQGVPMEAGLLAVTVIHASCMVADAIATALMVLGPERGQAFARTNNLACRISSVGEGGPCDIFSPAAQRMLRYGLPQTPRAGPSWHNASERADYLCHFKGLQSIRDG